MALNDTSRSKPVGELVAPQPPEGVAAVYDKDTLIKTPTRMNYVASETVKVSLNRDPSGLDSGTEGANWKEETVWVENGRYPEQNHCLHSNGFELVPNVPLSKDIDYLSKDDVLDRYYPHCEHVLATNLGDGVTVRAFDHNVRRQVSTTANSETVAPVGLVHGDYTTTSGPRRLQLLAEPPKVNDVWKERLGETPLLNKSVVEECLAGKRRWSLINVWRNIDTEHPVQSFPLACVDAQTHTKDDLRVLELVYQDRVGENFLVCPSEKHKWVYFPEMMYDEAMLIKQWDSFGNDKDISTFSIHSAFIDPVTPTDAPPRQSIEVRCVAIWDA